MKIKNIVFLTILLLLTLTGCSNNKIYIEDANKLLSEEDISSISHLTTRNYKFYIFISNEYSFENDYTFMSNEFINKHVINQDNLIMYYIGMEKHVINVQITDFVKRKITQHELDEAVSIMSNNFRNSEFAKGINDSILYLDNK